MRSRVKSEYWTGADFPDEREWVIPVHGESAGEVREEIAALAPDLRARLDSGCGFFVLRGLPLDRISEDAARALYLEIGGLLGRVVPQTVSGQVLYSVRDEGVRVEADYGRPGIRKSKTNAEFDFHTDSPSRLAGYTPDYVGLLVLRTARSGGESAWVSAAAVHRILSAERPDLLARLEQPFWVDRRSELPPGEEPVLPVPVFTQDGAIRARYLRFYIVKGQELRGEPLSDFELTALDYFDSVMRRPGVALMAQAERGDIQWINNTKLLHSRAAYEDNPDPALKRHYLRLWVAEG
jgi:alpha-ketoglutarate-dependent taurine dioxygenase